MSKVGVIHTSKDDTRPKTWAEFIGIERYEHAVYRLQDEIGLTFKEARVILTPHQEIAELAEKWGCSLENIYNLARSARKKVKEFTGGDPSLYEEYVPQELCYVP